MKVVLWGVWEVGVRSYCFARVKGDSNIEEGTAWKVLQRPGTLKQEKGLADGSVNWSVISHTQGCWFDPSWGVFRRQLINVSFSFSPFHSL